MYLPHGALQADELLARAAALARRRGWELRPQPYRDSPEKKHRPERGRLLEAVERGRIRVVICRRLEDLATSVLGLARVARRIEAAAGHLVALEEPVDTTASAGGALWASLRTTARFEQDRVNQEIAVGLERAQRRPRPGKRRPGRPRAGIDLEHAKALIRSGVSISDAARELGVAPSTLYLRLGE